MGTNTTIHERSRCVETNAALWTRMQFGRKICETSRSVGVKEGSTVYHLKNCDASSDGITGTEFLV